MTQVAVPTVTGRSTYAGTGRLLRLALRRDRVRLPLGIAGAVGFELLMAGSLVSVYPTAAERAGYLVTIDNPGSTFLLGRPYHVHDYNHGVMTGHQTLVWLSAIVAVLTILTVVRHTRAEEETGRAELVRAAQVGAGSQLAAALLVALLQLAGIAVGLALGLVLLGAEAVDGPGAVVYAAAVVACGLVHAAVTAVTAQVVPTGRAAGALATIVLAAGFLVRGAGDVGDNDLGWVSPFGWSQRTFPWDADDLTPLTLSVAVSAALLAVAVVLSRRRDVGAAVWADRPGRVSAPRTLLTGPGLVLRLNRANVTGWAIGLVVFGFVYGPVLSDAERFLRDMPVLEDFLPEASVAGGVRFFASVVVALGAMAAAVPAGQVVTRMARDEEAGRTAPLLAGPRSRLGWYAATVAVALVVGASMLLAFGVGFGVAAARAVDDAAMFGDVVGATLAYLPALGVVVGAGAALVGWLPRRAGLVWLLLVYAVVVFYFAELLEWPTAVVWPSPYDHVAARPAVHDDAAARLWLSVTTVLLLVVGGLGYRRRPIE